MRPALKMRVIMDEERAKALGGLEEALGHRFGDLSLLGIPIIGHFIAFKSGHRLNHLLLKELLVRQECWTLVSRFSRDGRPDGPPLRVPAFRVLDSIASSSAAR